MRVNNDAALAVLASLGVVRSRQVAEPGVYDLEVFLEGVDHFNDGVTVDSSGADAATAESATAESATAESATAESAGTGPAGSQDPDGDEERPGAIAFVEAVADKVINALGRER